MNSLIHAVMASQDVRRLTSNGNVANCPQLCQFTIRGTCEWYYGCQWSDVCQITSLTIVYWTFIQAQANENIKAPRHWPLWGGICRWPVNSPHKEPASRKSFHLMTSSCKSTLPLGKKIATTQHPLRKACLVSLEPQHGLFTYWPLWNLEIILKA